MDLEARDRVRATDVGEWVASQHRTGAAASNPNFIPISDTWRERVAARSTARAEAAAAADAAAAAESDRQETLFFEKKPDLDVLSVGLPEHWYAMWDPHSKGVYYGNMQTKVRVAEFDRNNATTFCSLGTVRMHPRTSGACMLAPPLAL